LIVDDLVTVGFCGLLDLETQEDLEVRDADLAGPALDVGGHLLLHDDGELGGGRQAFGSYLAKDGRGVQDLHLIHLGSGQHCVAVFTGDDLVQLVVEALDLTVGPIEQVRTVNAGLVLAPVPTDLIVLDQLALELGIGEPSERREAVPLLGRDPDEAIEDSTIVVLLGLLLPKRILEELLLGSPFHLLGDPSEHLEVSRLRGGSNVPHRVFLSRADGLGLSHELGGRTGHLALELVLHLDGVLCELESRVL